MPTPPVHHGPIYGSYPEKRSGDWRLKFAPTSRYTGVSSKPMGVAPA